MPSRIAHLAAAFAALLAMAALPPISAWAQGMAQQAAPIKLGVSGSLTFKVVDCAAGTLGALVQDTESKTSYILSAQHVLKSNAGADVQSVGTADDFSSTNTCGNPPNDKISAPFIVATVTKGVSEPKETKVDAAIAKIIEGKVSSAILNIAGFNPAPVKPQLKDLVMKQGRTTNLTMGVIDAVNVDVDYNGKKYIQQFVVVPAADGKVWGGAGDSGALVLKCFEGAWHPTGLVVGGNRSGTFGLQNGIDNVFAAFLPLKLVVVASAASPECKAPAAPPSEGRLAAAEAIQESVAASLWAIPGVYGHGIGVASNGSDQLVIKLYVRPPATAARAAAPAAMRGLPIEIVEAEPPEATD